MSQGGGFPVGRIVMYAALALLGLFVLTVTFFTENGGGSGASIAQISLHTLRAVPESYQGQTVTTEGTLSFSQELGLFQLVEEGNVVVVLQGYQDDAQLQALSGKRVRVTGEFRIDPGIGINIAVDVLRPAEE